MTCTTVSGDLKKYVTAVLDIEDVENGAERMSEEILAKIISDLTKISNIKTQESKQPPKRKFHLRKSLSQVKNQNKPK